MMVYGVEISFVCTTTGETYAPTTYPTSQMIEKISSCSISTIVNLHNFVNYLYHIKYEYH